MESYWIDNRNQKDEKKGRIVKERGGRNCGESDLLMSRAFCWSTLGTCVILKCNEGELEQRYLSKTERKGTERKGTKHGKNRVRFYRTFAP
jgi:hypothetical protein